MIVLKRIIILCLAILLITACIMHSNFIYGAVDELTLLTDNIKRMPDINNIVALKDVWKKYEPAFYCTFEHELLQDISVKITALPSLLNNEECGNFEAALAEIRYDVINLAEIQRINFGNIL